MLQGLAVWKVNLDLDCTKLKQHFTSLRVKRRSLLNNYCFSWNKPPDYVYTNNDIAVIIKSMLRMMDIAPEKRKAKVRFISYDENRKSRAHKLSDVIEVHKVMSNTELQDECRRVLSHHREYLDKFNQLIESNPFLIFNYIK